MRVQLAHYFTHFLPAFMYRPHQLLTAALGAEPGRLSTSSDPYYSGEESEAQRDDVTKDADPADLTARALSEYTYAVRDGNSQSQREKK